MPNFIDENGFADVSVIIPAYQSALTIGRALKSAANQTCKPREVVIVDDGSTDHTKAICVAFKTNMDGIDLKIYQQKNAGAGAARNRAIKEATGKYLAFLDADDEWLPEKLQISLLKMHDGNNVLTSHNYVSIKPKSKNQIDCAALFAATTQPYSALYRKGFIATSSVVVEREAVLNAGGFDQTLPNAQDFDLWLEILKRRPDDFDVFAEALTNYHVTPGSIMSHTASRLRCTINIACRHALSLKLLNQPVLINLWYRILAVHYEALVSYRDQNKPFSLILTAAQLPFNLIFATVTYNSNKFQDRPKFI
jgi:teichuronic acid biosynthesis glycosyltransferase TuaG